MLTPVCTGASGNLDEAIKLTQEVPALTASSHQRSTQLDTFILRRIDRFPEERDSKNFDEAYCRLLAFELLFLWNALPSCSIQHINNLLEGTEQIYTLRFLNCALSYTYVRRTSKMHNIFINDIIQLYYLPHVSNN